MTEPVTREQAESVFRRAEALSLIGRHDEAIAELRSACDLYRQLDVRGHPFNIVLENGITGLANAHYLLGTTLHAAGKLTEAISSLETSLVNERFERQVSFRSFRNNVHGALASCYEQRVRETDSRLLAERLSEDPAIDLSYRFPFSLDPPLITVARLYELDPAGHDRYRAFYERARAKDVALRRAESRTDDSSMRMISIGVWSVLVLVWIAYGLTVVRALLHQK